MIKRVFDLVIAVLLLGFLSVPMLIIALGIGVAILLVGVLMPMYNMAQNF